MDQHGEKEADDTAVEEKAEESTDRRAGYKAAGGLLIKEVVAAGGEESSSPAAALFANPCTLLQLLLRACAGCLGLHCDDPKPAAVAAAPDAAAEEGEGGDKANYLYMQEEVVTRVFAVRRPTPPGDRPREGTGGNGGVHH